MSWRLIRHCVLLPTMMLHRQRLTASKSCRLQRSSLPSASSLGRLRASSARVVRISGDNQPAELSIAVVYVVVVVVFLSTKEKTTCTLTNTHHSKSCITRQEQGHPHAYRYTLIMYVQATVHVLHKQLNMRLDILNICLEVVYHCWIGYICII